MTDDLVKRLRDQWEATPPDICHAAADRIEELEAALREIADASSNINSAKAINYYQIAKRALANQLSEPDARAALGEKKDG